MNKELVETINEAIQELVNVIRNDKDVQDRDGKINNILVDRWGDEFIVSAKVFYPWSSQVPTFYAISAYINPKTMHIKVKA